MVLNIIFHSVLLLIIFAHSFKISMRNKLGKHPLNLHYIANISYFLQFHIPSVFGFMHGKTISETVCTFPGTHTHTNARKHSQIYTYVCVYVGASVYDLCICNVSSFFIICCLFSRISLFNNCPKNINPFNDLKLNQL